MTSLSCDFVHFEPNRDAKFLPSLIRCYQSVFAGAPWNEWLKCTECHGKFGIEDFARLKATGFTCCKKKLEDFWPTSKVGGDFLKEITPDTSCWLAVRDDTVIGFCWGYSISPERLELKLDLKGLSQELHSRYQRLKLVAYQEDMGVLMEYRGKGVAKQLFLKRLDDFRQRGLTVGVVQTKTNPPSVTYSWFTEKLGYTKIAEYGDGDGSVVLAQSFNNI